MKKYLTYFFIALSFSFFAQQKVKVHITYTNSYCGGARPTPEIEAEYNTPKNLSNFMIWLGDKKIKKFWVKNMTDSLGIVIFTLKPGKYSIHILQKTNKELFINYDPACKQMLNLSYGELLIEKGKTDYKINLHFPCNPCEPQRQ